MAAPGAVPSLLFHSGRAQCPDCGAALELIDHQPTLLYFMDDCAVERPELLPYINECFYDGRAALEGDYLIRVELLDKLLTSPAKRALLEHLYSPPLDASDKKIGRCMERLLSLADNPRLGAAAIKCISDMMAAIDFRAKKKPPEMRGAGRRFHFNSTGLWLTGRRAVCRKGCCTEGRRR
jgi:hypothetical protein